MENENKVWMNKNAGPGDKKLFEETEQLAQEQSEALRKKKEEEREYEDNNISDIIPDGIEELGKEITRETHRTESLGLKKEGTGELKAIQVLQQQIHGLEEELRRERSTTDLAEYGDDTDAVKGISQQHAEKLEKDIAQKKQELTRLISLN